VESFEEPPRGDLARHDRVTGVKLTERFEHFTELTDEQGAAVGGGKGVHEVRACFLFKRHQLQGNAGGPGRCRDEDRIDALSSDERNGSTAVKSGGEEG
jgi:hypothetical protein